MRQECAIYNMEKRTLIIAFILRKADGGLTRALGLEGCRTRFYRRIVSQLYKAHHMVGAHRKIFEKF